MSRSGRLRTSKSHISLIWHHVLLGASKSARILSLFLRPYGSCWGTAVECRCSDNVCFVHAARQSSVFCMRYYSCIALNAATWSHYTPKHRDVITPCASAIPCPSLGKQYTRAPALRCMSQTVWWPCGFYPSVVHALTIEMLWNWLKVFSAGLFLCALAKAHWSQCCITFSVTAGPFSVMH